MVTWCLGQFPTDAFRVARNPTYPFRFSVCSRRRPPRWVSPWYHSRPGHASEAAEEEKHTHNDAACAQTGRLCEHFAATTFGALGRNLRLYVHTGKAAFSRGRGGGRAVESLLGRQLRVSLKREVARMLPGSPAGPPGWEEIEGGREGSQVAVSPLPPPAHTRPREIFGGSSQTGVVETFVYMLRACRG